MNWLRHEYYGNSTLDWLAALGITLGLVVVFYYARMFVVAKLRAYAQRSSVRMSGFVAEVLSRTYFLFLFVMALYLGLQFLDLPFRFTRVIDRAVVLVLLVQIALWANRAIHWWLVGTKAKTTSGDVASTTTVGVIGFIARTALWSVALLMILDNLGVDITALVTSLGIGGIAVALAVQNILGDIFASLSIALDKPFVVGDFIVVGDALGTVEYIGIKTTRVRSLSGEQIIFSNADLLKSRIHNYKRMAERRVRFAFGVVYETPADALERIPAMVRAIIEAQAHTRFDRAHFQKYGDSSLDFEVVYYVLSSEYNVYMDIQQAINLALFREFEREGIAFAYPTRTLYVRSAKHDDAEQARDR